MTTVSSYLNHALIKATKIVLLSASTLLHRAHSIDAEAKFSELPSAVKTYIGSLTKIKNQQPSSDCAKTLSEFLLSVSSNKQSANDVELLADKLSLQIKANKPLHLVIVGYPFKSTNTDKKVISAQADMGELVGLLTLNHLIREINTVYNPGAVITIYSDGSAYKDLLEVPDHAYQAYQNGFAAIVSKFEGHIKLKTLNPALSSDSIVTVDEETKQDIYKFMKNELDCKLWEEKIAKLAEKELPSDSELAKKAKEDLRGSEKLEQKRAIQNINTRKKEIKREKIDKITEMASTYSAIFAKAVREDLWDEEYIRLSVHPHSGISKIGIKLVQNSFGTPWHMSPLIAGDQFKLVKKETLKKVMLRSIKIESYDLAYFVQIEDK